MPREWQKRKKLLLRRRRSSTSLRLLHEGLDKIKNVEGARLKAFIKCIAEQDVPDINVGNKNAKVQKCLDKLKLDIFNAISVVDEFYLH